MAGTSGGQQVMLRLLLLEAAGAMLRLLLGVSRGNAAPPGSLLVGAGQCCPAAAAAVRQQGMLLRSGICRAVWGTLHCQAQRWRHHQQEDRAAHSQGAGRGLGGAGGTQRRARCAPL
jgi:hypothetical protein